MYICMYIYIYTNVSWTIIYCWLNDLFLSIKCMCPIFHLVIQQDLDFLTQSLYSMYHCITSRPLTGDSTWLPRNAKWPELCMSDRAVVSQNWQRLTVAPGRVTCPGGTRDGSKAWGDHQNSWDSWMFIQTVAFRGIDPHSIAMSNHLEALGGYEWTSI